MKDEDLSALPVRYTQTGVPAQADKTKEQLIGESAESPQRAAELEESEAERKFMQEALREPEQIYKTIIENSLTGISIHQDGKYVFVNNRFTEIHGYNREELLGKDHLSLIHPDERDAIRKIASKRLKGEGVPQRYEVRRLRKDGKIIWCEMMATRIQYRERPAIMGTIIDITDRKQAEEELRESEKRYRSVFENTGTATVIIEEDMIISMANTEFEKLSGYSKKEIEGKKKWTEFVVKEDLERMREYHAKRRENESKAPKEYEFHFIDRKGNLKDIFIKVEIIPGTKRSVTSLMDITSRNQTEKMLRENEERFRRLAEDSPFGLSIMKPDKTFEYLNPKFTEIFGYTIEEIPDKTTWFERAYPNGEYRREMISVWEKDTVKDVKGREIKQRVFTARCKDGQDKIIRFRNVSLKDGRQFLTYEDITAQTEAEQALQQSEERYKTLVEESFDGIFVQKGPKIIFANQRFHKMLGYDEGELLGLDHWLVYHPDYQELTRKRAQARMRGEMVTSRYEVKLQRKDGSWFYGEINARAISLEREPGVQVWVRDITERKKAEEEIKKRQKYLESVLHDAPDAIVTLNASHLILEWNPGAERIFGYSRDEVVGKNLDDLITRSDINVSKEATGYTRRVLAGERVPPVESIRYKKDGTPVNVILAASPMLIGDEVIGVIAIYKDITEHKRAEEEKRKLEAQLQHAQRMEAIGTLAGGIAHNFNNLLMGIQGNASLMLLDTDPTNPNYERLKNIEKMVHNGSKLTSQLLGYAKGGRYEVRPISLNKLVEETSDTFDTTRKEIRVHRELAQDLYGIKADQGQIEQVLMNLYVNAADAMPGGGDLFIKTMNVTHEDMAGKPYKVKPGNYVLLTVTDSGIGMDKKTMERIFDPFFTTKGLSKGTGLGLASVYGIIKAHGGYIDVYSEKGHGATFKIYLPATSAKRKELGREGKEKDKMARGKETVLLVDDEDMILDIGQEMLTIMGYQVLTARSGKEAIDIISRAHGAKSMEQEEKGRYAPGAMRFAIDLVILDMIMPGMGGGETYDKLREINPDIKVLLSSGYNIEGEATEILKRGCDGFIQKPFNMKHLSQKIREILDNPYKMANH